LSADGGSGSQALIKKPAIGPVKVLDVRVRVFAWQLNGQLASNVEFAWTCLAEGVITAKV
jgi:hypothetical protein